MGSQVIRPGDGYDAVIYDMNKKNNRYVHMYYPAKSLIYIQNDGTYCDVLKVVSDFGLKNKIFKCVYKKKAIIYVNASYKLTGLQKWFKDHQDDIDGFNFAITVLQPEIGTFMESYRGISEFDAYMNSITKISSEDKVVISAIISDTNTASKMAESESKILKILKNDPESVFEDVTETTDKGTYIECKINKSGIKADIPKSKLTPAEIDCLENGCFTGETLVETSTGLRRIDSLNIGDLVLSKDVKTGDEAYKKVLTVYKKTTNELYVLNVNGESITTTSGHLFMMSTGLWKSAKNIKAGDKIVDADGSAREVKGVEIKELKDYIRIYNLNVEDYHTYFVGNEELLVHNNCSEAMTAIRSAAIPKFTSRLIDPIIDSKIINRVKELRASLTSAFKKSGNFGYADVNVSGLSRNEFYAHSSIDRLTGELTKRVPNMSIKPDNPVFDAIKVNSDNVIDEADGYLRDVDSEYKILNDIASKLGSRTDVSGTIKLFTDRPPCPSCSRVINMFIKKYNNITIEVLHNDGNILY